MKKILLPLLLIFCATSSNSQTNVKDSLNQLLQKEKEDTSRVLLLSDISFEYLDSNPDTAMALALEALSLARQIGFAKGESVGINRVGTAYDVLANYPKAMDFFLQALKVNEKIKNLDGVQRNLNNIGLVYNQQGDYRQALEYFFKSIDLAVKINYKRGLAIAYSNLGDSYYGLKILDSSRVYNQLANDVSSGINYHRITGISFYAIGDIYSETGQNALALEYYRLSVPYLKKAQHNRGLSKAFLGIAKVFEKTGQKDSVLFYANQAVSIAKEKGFTKELMDASSQLSTFYKNRRNADSAFFYLEVAKAANDSIFSQQKNKQLQSLAIDEKIRQQEIAAAELKAEEKRRDNLQYATIAIGLITFSILFLLVSHTVIANPRLIRFLGVIALLIVFEFINLYIHPYLAHATNDSPLLMLLVMVCIAALLVPAHHRLEKWITHKLSEKNRSIRLAAAKKTIARIEEKETT